jgi:hypothetical protein
MVFQVLREHRLYIKLRKCGFYHKHMHYLGHNILDGVFIDMKIISVIVNWPT